jgi:hypothetical protein
MWMAVIPVSNVGKRGNINTTSPVGASLLAMVVNDYAGNLTPRGVPRSIASRLSPTEAGVSAMMAIQFQLSSSG